MRLINTETLELHEFTSSQKIPPYAILSHTWGSDDSNVSLETYQENDKIEKFCAQARRDKCRFAWIDTVCIKHKKASERTPAEKEEHRIAINSMYTWFGNAKVCYAYLDFIIDPNLDRRSEVQQQLLRSHWFTSGWTLIELIAPPDVHFYQKDWTYLGNKKEKRGIISKITGIPQELLADPSKLQDYTVFDRMSWARHRMTTGIEDQAYCLYGLFEVEMPPDYTEIPDSEAFEKLRGAIKEKHGAASLDQPAAPLRLLRIDSLLIESHPRHGQPIPPYAILSHTWDKDEITFQDMQFEGDLAEDDTDPEKRKINLEKRKRILEGKKKLAYDKIIGCCNLAAKHRVGKVDKIEYVWVDTCCIDRSSSSELQEAICSMWRWYKNAKICYAYLIDHDAEQEDSLWACKWFNRGWTLQELIAPKEVHFYDNAWQQIGTKTSLCEEIALITQIDTKILMGTADHRKRSIAERMSWAASRVTSRLEDVAYCLMGLFDVNMPMLYGEGTQAFIRLQEEIIRRTEDYTIFAWTADPLNNMPRGLFASFPADFKLSGRSFLAPEGKRPEHTDAGSRYKRVDDQHDHTPSLTSRGLHVNLPRMSMARVDKHGRMNELGEDRFLAWICSIDGPVQDNVKGNEQHHDPKTGATEELMICIELREDTEKKAQRFVRHSPRHLYIRSRRDFEKKFKSETIYALSAGKPENSQ